MLVVGLTGGIGSGKTTVAAFFAALGVPVIDTDIISRELTTAGGRAISPIREAFGDDVLQSDGSLDRAAMRAIILSAPEKKKRLEAILHPLIREEVSRQLADTQSAYAMVVIPLLYETGGYQDILDRVLVVDCPESIQLQRALARGGWSEAELVAIMRQQAGRDLRLRQADDVIENSGSPDVLVLSVQGLHRKYLALAAGQ